MATATENNTGLTPAEYRRIEKLIAENSAAIAQTGRELATNFDVPARATIAYACSKMGISLLDWEKITAVQSNWEYTPPPKHVLARWQRY